MLPDEDTQKPLRALLDRIGDCWSSRVLCALGSGPTRFSALHRAIRPISKRMLAKTLRALEEDGLASRTVFPTNPPSVEYDLTKLGATLLPHLQALAQWAQINQQNVENARKNFQNR